MFCRTKIDTQKVAEKLIEDGYNAGALHGDLSQSQRDLVMKSFRNKQIQFLVATDVAARGIDVDNITHVINYQLPDEIETYTHRSGRTGRAGKTGISLVIVSKSELRKIGNIQKKIKKEFIKKDIPSSEEICKIQLFTLANKVNKTEVNNNIDEYIEEINNLFKKTKKADLIKKFFSVEFNRYFDYYQKSKNLNVEGDQHSYSDFSDSDESSSTRYFINIGQKDGYDWMSLKDFLKDVLELGKDDVFKVDVKESFSFFNTEEVHKEKILAFFTDFKENGRFVNVEISKDIKRNRGKGRSNRGDRRGGKRGFKKSNSRRSDSRNSDRSSRRSRSNESDRGSRRSSFGGSDKDSNSKRFGSRESENNSSSRRSKSFNADSYSRPRRSRRK